MRFQNVISFKKLNPINVKGKKKKVNVYLVLIMTIDLKKIYI